MQSPEDTIAAIATPLGEAGLGVIRVSGVDAIKVVSKIFRKINPSSPDVLKASSHTCHVGFIFDDTVIDQVVVTLFRAPHSYTGQDVVEISAHGNPFTLQKILNVCLKNGARLAGPGEFTQRAFLNGKMDLTQAEAVAELIGAKSDKSQAAALAQMQGGLARKVRGLRDNLLALLAHVEVGLDHADEDHDFLARENLAARCREVQTGIDNLLQSARVGKVLREGLRVAFLGKPNVGKSSLLNALLKEDRAIVTSTPGTTRDTLEESVHWDGIPVILTDTAGLRQNTTDPIEHLGMERTRKSLAAADVIVGLFDGSEILSTDDEEVIRQAALKPHLWVINKCDLPQRWTCAALDTFNGKAPAVNLSAKTGEGLDDLIKTLTRLAIDEKAQASEAEWLLNARHQAALERAREALAQAAKAAQTKTFEECIALELQTALQALGEIIGETTTEDLLGQIFSKFCIGK
jgi:tRNA modification GTPase